MQPERAAATCVIVGENCAREQCQHLRERGLTVIPVALDARGYVAIAAALAALLAQQGIMHVLLEGGAKLLGSAFDNSLIDHASVFIAPKLVGGIDAPSPIQGLGLAQMRDAVTLRQIRSQIIDEDLLIDGELSS